MTKGEAHEAVVAPFLSDLVAEASDTGAQFYARDGLVLKHVPRLQQVQAWQLT